MSTTTTNRTTFELAPVPARTRLWLWLLAGVLPTAAAAGLFGTLAARGEIAPATALLAAVSAVLPLLVIAWAVSRMMRSHRLVLHDDGLRVVTGAHRQRLSLAELELERARVLDLGEHLEFKPRMKTSGAFLPGFQSGWYRLRNGSRALVARSGGARVLWIPTTRDFGLLLQPLQPRELLQALREAASGGTIDSSAIASAQPEKTYWFPAKQYGWGWGIPSAWQGWLVLGLYLAGLTALSLLGPEDWFMAGLAVLTAIVIAICFLKGEPPRWRWGNKDDDD